MMMMMMMTAKANSVDRATGATLKLLPNILSSKRNLKTKTNATKQKQDTKCRPRQPEAAKIILKMKENNKTKIKQDQLLN